MEFPANSAYFSLNSSLFVQQGDERNKVQSNSSDGYESTTSHQASNHSSNYNYRSVEEQQLDQKEQSLSLKEISKENNALKKRVKELEEQLGKEKAKVTQMNRVTIKLSDQIRSMTKENQARNEDLIKQVEQKILVMVQKQKDLRQKKQVMNTQRWPQNKVSQMVKHNQNILKSNSRKQMHRRSKSKDRYSDGFSSINSEKENRSGLNNLSSLSNMTLPAELDKKEQLIKQIQSNRISENNKNSNRIMSNLNFMNKEDIKKAIKTLSKIQCRMKK